MTLEEKISVVNRIFAYIKANIENLSEIRYEVIRNMTANGEPIITSKPGSSYKWFLKIDYGSRWTYWPGGDTVEQVYDMILEGRNSGKWFFSCHSSQFSWAYENGKDPYFEIMEKIRRPKSTEELLIILSAEGY